MIILIMGSLMAMMVEVAQTTSKAKELGDCSNMRISYQITLPSQYESTNMFSFPHVIPIEAQFTLS